MTVMSAVTVVVSGLVVVEVAVAVVVHVPPLSFLLFVVEYVIVGLVLVRELQGRSEKRAVNANGILAVVEMQLKPCLSRRRPQSNEYPASLGAQRIMTPEGEKSVLVRQPISERSVAVIDA